jgi:aryl-alcohol dehydrogenase (NADP+)
MRNGRAHRRQGGRGRDQLHRHGRRVHGRPLGGDHRPGDQATADAWVLATKVGNPTGSGPNDRGLSRAHVFRAAEASLARLGLDHIDIYYLHREDPATPLAETVRALGDLVRAGKIRHFGLSNFRAWRVAEICRLCDENGIDRPVVSQPYYKP